MFPLWAEAGAVAKAAPQMANAKMMRAIIFSSPSANRRIYCHQKAYYRRHAAEKRSHSSDVLPRTGIPQQDRKGRLASAGNG